MKLPRQGKLRAVAEEDAQYIRVEVSNMRSRLPGPGHPVRGKMHRRGMKNVHRFYSEWRRWEWLVQVTDFNYRHSEVRASLQSPCKPA